MEIEELRKKEKKTDLSSVVNERIQEYKLSDLIDTNNISNGTHTFGELYKMIEDLKKDRQMTLL